MDALEKYLSKPSNRQRLLWIVGIILLYFYMKKYRNGTTGGQVLELPNKAVSADRTAPYIPGNDTPVGSYAYFAEPLPYTHTLKNFFTLTRTDSQSGKLYSDTYAGDRMEDGVRKIDANGRTFTAFYWINEVPYEYEDGRPRNFNNVIIPGGLIVSVRKVYAQSNWVTTFQELRAKGYESWYLNSEGDENKIYKTAIVSITT